MAASALLTADRLRISYLGPILGQLQHEELAWDRRGSAAQGGTETDFGGSDDACVEPICLGRVKFPSKPSIHFFGQITDALFTCGFSIERQPFSLWRGSHGRRGQTQSRLLLERAEHADDRWIDWTTWSDGMLRRFVVHRSFARPQRRGRHVLPEGRHRQGLGERRLETLCHGQNSRTYPEFRRCLSGRRASALPRSTWQWVHGHRS